MSFEFNGAHGRWWQEDHSAPPFLPPATWAQLGALVVTGSSPSLGAVGFTPGQPRLRRALPLTERKSIFPASFSWFILLGPLGHMRQIHPVPLPGHSAGEERWLWVLTWGLSSTQGRASGPLPPPRALSPPQVALCPGEKETLPCSRTVPADTVSRGDCGALSELICAPPSPSALWGGPCGSLPRPATLFLHPHNHLGRGACPILQVGN